MVGRSLRSSLKKVGGGPTAATTAIGTPEAASSTGDAAEVTSAGPSKKPVGGGISKKPATRGGSKAKAPAAAATISRQEKAAKREAATRKEAEDILEMLLSRKTPRDPQTERVGKEHPSKKAEQVVLQLKVTLSELEPKSARAWRRILVPAMMTFRELHVTIQKAFDWRQAHVYEFRMGTDSRNRFRRTMTEPTVIGEIFPFKYIDDMEDSSKKILHEYLWKEGDLALYTYDLGDEWNHSIVVEKVLDRKAGEKYPKVLDGKRCAPPEDCGSIPGFEMLLEAMKKPETSRTEDEKDRIEWLQEDYPGYDPSHFDPSQISFEGLFFHFNK